MHHHHHHGINSANDEKSVSKNNILYDFTAMNLASHQGLTEVPFCLNFSRGSGSDSSVDEDYNGRGQLLPARSSLLSPVVATRGPRVHLHQFPQKYNNKLLKKNIKE